jgi:hypothetical protein
MKKILIRIFFLFLAIKSYSQHTILEKNSMFFKSTGFFEVCIDQLQTGLYKSVNDFSIDSLKIENVQLVPLKSTGFANEFIFYKLVFKYPLYKQEFAYVFCYNESGKRIFKLSGFYRNEYYSFFKCLEDKGIKISANYFIKNNLTVKDLNFLCLIEVYHSSKKAKQDLLDKLDRSKKDCLTYNFQPITTY